MIEVLRANACECLYLQKGSPEVFVNNCQLLKQHQINGLRFLYTQFRKKKQGVIVNFPTHTGKSVTVVLFLHAVINLLKKPVLILCKNDNEMFVWKEYFLRWTDLSEDDIEVESRKVVRGKKIFIKKVDSLTHYQHHSWSIVIVKDDLADKNMCQITDAEYKIWVTSTDMKKDIKMLAFISNWLYPKMKLNVDDFTPIEKTSKEILLKSIYLDTFLEDFVIREEDIKQFDIIQESKISEGIPNERSDSRLKKSRKNKDATGTKIKRSRRIIDDDDDETNEIKTTKLPAVNESDVVKHSGEELNEVTNELINHINNDKSTICAPLDCHVIEENLSPNVKTNVETDMEIDSTQSMNFGDAVNEIVSNENRMQTENSTESIYSEEIGNETNVNLGSDKESLSIVNNEEQGILNHSIIVMNDRNVDRKENCKETVGNEGSDPSKTNEVTSSHNIDTKLTELEERTMKKFKGSLLDSIF